MKIVFISSSFYPSIGGVETHVLNVADELVKLGNQVTVITEYKQSLRSSASPAGLKGSNKKIKGIKIVRLQFRQGRFIKLLNIWLELIKNRKLFKEADVIHSHDVFIWYLPFRFIFPYKKVFTTFHGYEGRFPPVEKSIWIRKISEKLSNGNICVGEFITRWYKTKPDYIVYGGVGTEKTIIIKPPRKRNIKIVLIGRLAKDIGVQIYRDALRSLRRDGYKFELEVCGDGEMKEDLKKYGKVLGFVKSTKEYIKKADIIFASSYLTMLSVMQMGKPVFAVYSNPLKHDYLYSSPFSKYAYIYSSGKELSRSVKNYKPNLQRLESAQKWSNSQTWSSIAQIYLELWSKK
jgi:glycosyltransferase involved in cell wall biosynthesis